MTNKSIGGDFCDSINIRADIFDQQKQERDPFELDFCCLQKTKCHRALVIVILHYLIIISVVLFSVGYLALSSQTQYHSGVLALLSACIGYIIPGPKT